MKRYHLNCIKGPLSGKNFPLVPKGRGEKDEVITIGRQTDNQVVLESPKVSRYHAIILVFGSHIFLKDLESQNGTFVNNKKIESSEHNLAIELKQGDQLSLGEYIFEVGQTSQPLVEKGPTDIHSNAQINILQEAYQALAQSSDIKQYKSLFTEFLFQVFEVERACIMTYDQKQKTLIPDYFANSFAKGKEAHFEPSMMVLHHVINEKSALFTVDAGNDARLKDGQSIAAAGVRSIICAPIKEGQELRGAVYIDTLHSDKQLEPEQQSWLELVALLYQSGLKRFT